MENKNRKRQKVSYTMPPNVIEKLKEHSKKTNINMSVLVQLAIEDYLRKEEQGVQEQ